ncbi:SET domain-containing protein [Cadophora sp. DSE1049]|nr:SET domain-containing protein [Cadophora sp. DSE1049]
MIDVRTAGAKGLGVFAKKLIPRGTRIFSERPLLTIHGHDASTLYPAVKLLNTKDRDAFMALSSFRDRELDLMRWSVVLVHTAQNTISSLLHALLGRRGFALLNNRNSLKDHVEALSIFRSNAFNIGPKLGTSLFPRIARINHSCLPNAQGNFHEPLGKFNVHATRDIQADEEVSLNYLLETGALRHVRVDKLSRGYGFDCACPACDMSGKRGMKGEERRVAMHEVLKAFIERPMAGDISDKEAEMETMKAFIELYESEGIAGKELSNLYLKAADISFGMQNLKGALVYAAQAARLDRDTFGEDHPDYRKSLEIVNTFKTVGHKSRTV